MCETREFSHFPIVAPLGGKAAKEQPSLYGGFGCSAALCPAEVEEKNPAGAIGSASKLWRGCSAGTPIRVRRVDFYA